MGIQKVMLIHGGLRSDGTSYSFARTFKMLFEERGIDVEIAFLTQYPKNKSIEDLVNKLEQSDLIGFIFPVYADHICAGNMEVIDILYESYRDKLKGRGVFAIAQCGFPDITRCEPIVDYLRFFALACGMKWCGGLGYGGAPMINGAYLETFGKEGRRIIAGFTQGVDELLKGMDISEEVQEKIEIRLPRITYRFWTALLSYMSRKKGKAKGVTDLLKPVYLEGYQEK